MLATLPPELLLHIVAYLLPNNPIVDGKGVRAARRLGRTCRELRKLLAKSGVLREVAARTGLSVWPAESAVERAEERLKKLQISLYTEQRRAEERSQRLLQLLASTKANAGLQTMKETRLFNENDHKDTPFAQVASMITNQVMAWEKSVNLRCAHSHPARAFKYLDNINHRGELCETQIGMSMRAEDVLFTGAWCEEVHELEHRISVFLEEFPLDGALVSRTKIGEIDGTPLLALDHDFSGDAWGGLGMLRFSRDEIMVPLLDTATLELKMIWYSIDRKKRCVKRLGSTTLCDQIGDLDVVYRIDDLMSMVGCVTSFVFDEANTPCCVMYNSSEPGPLISRNSEWSYRIRSPPTHPLRDGGPICEDRFVLHDQLFNTEEGGFWAHSVGTLAIRTSTGFRVHSGPQLTWVEDIVVHDPRGSIARLYRWWTDEFSNKSISGRWAGDGCGGNEADRRIILRKHNPSRFKPVAISPNQQFVLGELQDWDEHIPYNGWLVFMRHKTTGKFNDVGPIKIKLTPPSVRHLRPMEERNARFVFTECSRYLVAYDWDAFNDMYVVDLAEEFGKMDNSIQFRKVSNGSRMAKPVEGKLLRQAGASTTRPREEKVSDFGDQELKFGQGGVSCHVTAFRALPLAGSFHITIAPAPAP